MGDESRAVWVEGVEPTLVSSDDILDLAKIVGDVETVKLQYHAIKRSVFYRVVFKQSNSAQAFLHLEGTRFKDCTLHLSSSLYGSVDPPPVPSTVVDEQVASKQFNHRGQHKEKDSHCDRKTDTKTYASLPFFHHFNENCRMDEALIPSYEMLQAVVEHWKDPEHCSLPKDLSAEELTFLETNFGLDVLCPLLDEFSQLHLSVGQTLKKISELKERRVENELKMDEFLKKQQSASSAAGSKLHSSRLRAGLEPIEFAGRAKLRRIRNTIAVSSDVSHPLTLLLSLSTVCGPVTLFHVTYVADGSVNLNNDGKFAFHMCVEFGTEDCALRALSMLQGVYEPPKKKLHTVGWSPQGSLTDDTSAIASLSLLKSAQWEMMDQVYQFPMPRELPVLDDETVRTWAARIRGAAR